jgi:hypothetical protein
MDAVIGCADVVQGYAEEESPHIKWATFRMASDLTEPLCYMHELWRRMDLVGTSANPTTYKVEQWARKCVLFCGAAVSGATAVIATPLGIVLRWAACKLQKTPYVYRKGFLPQEQLQGNSLRFLSWNTGCCSAGYGISDGGLWPWSFRIDTEIAKGVTESNAHVACLYEIDPEAGFRLYDKLKSQYAHVYLNIGPTGFGVPSWMFVASKLPLANVRFEPFPKEILLGTRRFAEKGILSFEVLSQGKKVATVFATHLLDSKIPAKPLPDEIQARERAMEILMTRVRQVHGGAVILTGDLNADDPECQASPWYNEFTEVNDFKGEKTWGGDAFCATLYGREASEPLNLDHTMILTKSAQGIITTLGSTIFKGTEFGGDSDHRRLLSEISLLT